MRTRLNSLWLRCLMMLLVVFATPTMAQTIANGVQKAKDLTCQGKFVNPITDICWSCVLPIKIGGGYTLMAMGQEDYDSMGSDKKMLCACSNPTRVGVQLSFWEPTHLIETVRHPFCMVSLGGLNWGKTFNDKVSSNDSLAKWFGGSHKEDNTKASMGGGSTASFYQAHWYKNPVIYWLQVILGDDYCLDKGTMDIGWMTELDPTWKSPELAMLQAPDAALFANPIAQAVCAADCIKANMGFPSEKLFWCAGCHGSVYPFTGFISNQVSPVQAAKLMVARIQTKMHRDFVAHTATGKAGLCGFRLQPLMDKRQYKMAMTYPIPARKTNGKCCEPIGRTTLVRDIGKSFPYKGQDFAYQIFRKRDCCAAYKYN
ncbi:TraU family protein [Hydromonas duriensis]|uniref:Conjugal transfer pilus assembly protein TraU n=1 Tax=Hydromonas duriensis TaxID=1527608 RepID=A0A4R6Y1J1_9BURK|nr:TraU family protein [Hydromonas duriensis]TDR30292.1 conjugal transfer pilus assembly protein TraU [Hydromonas duriensis]